MSEPSVNVTLGVEEVIKEVKDTKTIEEVDKTSALVVRAIHAALSPLEKWVLQKEYNLAETKKLLDICVPGGGYIFDFNACIDLAKRENMEILLDTIHSF